MSPTIDLKSSKIYIKRGILEHTGEMIKERFSDAKVLVVTDQTVGKHYLSRVTSALESQDIAVDTITFNDGEPTKTLTNIETLCEKAADMNLNRGDVILALGGGVIGDLAGFAAAVFLRGIKFVAIPTTLLAQVDSSVGGKTGVNLKQGKNLVGSFYKADIVLIDTDMLKTLDDRQFQCGMAETIKYGCIWDKALFSLLETLKTREQVMTKIEDIVTTCCEIKAEVVRQDEFDKALRMILNFGHTIGHAIENVSGYGEISHGEAVAVGMTKITAASERMGITQHGTTKRIVALLIQHGLKTDIETYDREKILSAMKIDKKNIGKSMHIILLKQIGEVEIKELTPEAMEAYV